MCAAPAIWSILRCVRRLAAVPAYMAYMLGLRFLIDYLDGDTYFRVAHPKHNLVRARSQFRLFQLMVDARAELDHIVRRA